MRSRFKTSAVIGVLLALALAITGAAAAPSGAKQAPAVAKQAKHKKHKKVNAGPIPSNFFGIVPIFAPSASDAQQMSAAGVESVRLFAYWGLLEPQPGVFDWSLSDAVMQNVAAAGLTPAMQFANSPSWISPSDPNRAPIYSSAQIAAWQEFLSNFARRYGPNGSFWAAHPSLPYHPTTSYEIWNEPNFYLNWGGTPNAGDYLKLLQVSKSALRGVDPSAQIIFAGLFPFPRPEFGVKALKFLNSFFRHKGAKKSFDVLSLHPYSYTPKDVVPTVRLFRKNLNAHRSARKPIWITELGWTTGGHDWAIAPFKATEAQQAQYLTQSFNKLIGARGELGLQRIYWHDWKDHPDPDAAWLNMMGLLRADGSQKPAYSAYQAEAQR
jgi:polysaccharide biosynthesis protein PslG